MDRFGSLRIFVFIDNCLKYIFSDNESENSFMNEDAVSEYSYGDVSQKNSDDESDTHSEISVEDKKERKERRKKRF